MTANAACSFEEVDELAEGEGVIAGMEMRMLGTSPSICAMRVPSSAYLVYFVDAFACDVVEAVEVRLVGGMRSSCSVFSTEITVSKIMRSPSCIH